MSRKNRDQHGQKRSSGRTRWPIAVVVVVVLGAVAMILVPHQRHSGTPSVSAPMFTKQGEATLLRHDGTTAVTIDIEIAETQEKREIGLMGRPTMEERQGMLFIFEEVQPLAFWMKNTLLPLDMFFIDDDGTINTIHRNTAPYSEQTYPSRKPGKYVLETNAGFADKYSLTEGDRIVWKRAK